MAEGQPADEACRARAPSLGSPLAVRDHTRDVWTLPGSSSSSRDIRYGWRQLTAAKMRSAAAIVSLALALGACLATFAVMDALLFRPLPVDGADRLHVMVRESARRRRAATVVRRLSSIPLFLRIRADHRRRDPARRVLRLARRRHPTDAGQDAREGLPAVRLGRPLRDVSACSPAAGRLLRPATTRRRCSSAGRDHRGLLDPPLRAQSSRPRPHRLRSVPTDFEIVGVVAAPSPAPSPASASTCCCRGDAPQRRRNSARPGCGCWPSSQPGVSRRPRARPVAGARHRLPARSRSRVHRHPGGDSRQRLLTERVRLDPASSGVSTMQARYRRRTDGHRRAGRAGVAGRLRQRRQPDDCAHRGALEGAGPPHLAWRRSAQRVAVRAGRVRLDCRIGRRARRRLRGLRGVRRWSRR